MSETAIETVDRFNQAWGAHDLDATIAMTTPDCIFDATGPAPDGARCEGTDQIRAAWTPIFADANTVFTVEEMFAADDRVVQRWRYDWDGGHVRGVDLFTIRDGLVAEKLSYVKG